MSETPETILLVEDDDSFRRALTEVLAVHGFAVAAAADARAALEILQSESVDLVISDLVMPGMKGDELLARIRSAFPQTPVIAITAFGSVENALDLTRAGAADYLTKPFRTRALISAVERVLEESRAGREQMRARAAVGEHLEGIVGASAPMLELFDRMGRVAPSPAPVLIQGESGVGKELVARAIHRASGRAPFVPVNCGALPDQLLESELFGHARGAFTGADRETTGLFEAAHGGTLLLDEIAELPLALQPKLLRAIESGEVRRVGEVEPRVVDVRILAATHRDLEQRVEAGTFREDLFWRLNVLHIDVPPLRDRPADIPLLVERFLADVGERQGGPAPEVTTDALAVLVDFHWPGNVRQLFNVLERAVAFADGPQVRLEDLPQDIRNEGRAAAIRQRGAAREATLAEIEREYILEILERTDGNKTRAAEILGIPRRTLYRRLDEFGAGAG